MAPANTQDDDHCRRKHEHEIRDAISSLTHHLTALGRSAARTSDSHAVAMEPHNGVPFIRLAGKNSGAAMKADAVGEVTETHGFVLGDEKALRAFTNSNFQAVNNSVLLGGSCIAEDPGVNIRISEDGEEEEEGKRA
ncbi:hypothetical protein HPP92_007135 [Vanilla planifolia]|uniref:Uncharacterized protein n=2 Tax=Vanilla planifolia TaxID=51239 RepID=A0A835RQL9_VANPL|nr:hypothetical protein HPP92_007135 [Vanilla planifolia]